MMLGYLISFLVAAAAVTGLVMGALSYIQAQDNKDAIKKLHSQPPTTDHTHKGEVAQSSGSMEVDPENSLPNEFTVTLHAKHAGADMVMATGVLRGKGSGAPHALHPKSVSDTAVVFEAKDLPRAGHVVEPLSALGALTPSRWWKLFEVAGYPALIFDDAANNIRIMVASEKDGSKWGCAEIVVAAAHRTAARPFTVHVTSTQVVVAFIEDGDNSIEVRYASLLTSLKAANFTKLTNDVAAAAITGATCMDLVPFEFEGKMCLLTNSTDKILSAYQLHDVTLTADTLTNALPTVYTAAGALQAYAALPVVSDTSANSDPTVGIFYRQADGIAQWVRPISGAKGVFKDLTTPYTQVVSISGLTNVTLVSGADVPLVATKIGESVVLGWRDENSGNEYLKTVTFAQSEATSITASTLDMTIPDDTVIACAHGGFADNVAVAADGKKIVFAATAVNSANYNLLAEFNGTSWEPIELHDLGAHGDYSAKSVHRLTFTSSGALWLFWLDGANGPYKFDYFADGKPKEIFTLDYQVTSQKL